MRTALLLVIIPILTACSSFQGLFGDNVVTDKLGLSKEQPLRYSANPQAGAPSHRQYRRMTRSRLEEESELHSQAGSMWVQEGQTAYLFVQNKTRREGDVLNVKLEGAALKQVETKVGVIKKLLKQLEEQAQMQQKLAENGAEPGRAPAAAKPEEKKTAAKEEKEEMDVKDVTTKIVERLPDGNYRVKGSQPFMIGKREYKVIVMGLIRPEDYNDEGVISSKLLDPQYDVVSVRRKQNNEQL